MARKNLGFWLLVYRVKGAQDDNRGTLVGRLKTCLYDIGAGEYVANAFSRNIYELAPGKYVLMVRGGVTRRKLGFPALPESDYPLMWWWETGEYSAEVSLTKWQTVIRGL